MCRADRVVLSNLSEQEKVAKDIASTEELLSETLSRLTRLRRQHQALRDRTAEVFRRGMEGLEAAEEPDSPKPMSEEQFLVGQAQSLGAFGVIDWEAMGLSDSLAGSSSWLPEPEAPVDPGSSDGTLLVSPGTGGS